MEQHSAMSEDKDIFELECKAAEQRERLKLLAMQIEILKAKVAYNEETIATITAVKEYKGAEGNTAQCGRVCELIDLINVISCDKVIDNSRAKEKLHKSILAQSESNAVTTTALKQKDKNENCTADENLFTVSCVDEGVEIVGYGGEGESEKLIIPNTIRGKLVVGIGARAFSEKKIVSVYFPETVRYIKGEAFSKCIELETVKLPEKLESLGRNTFRDCENIRSIVIPGTVAEIPSACFANCKRLSNVILNNGLAKIGASAFADTAIDNIIIPNSVSWIGRWAFATVSTKRNMDFQKALKGINFVILNSDNIVIETSALGNKPSIYCRQQSYIWRLARASGCAVKQLSEYVL